jgi:hypothetical protein
MEKSAIPVCRNDTIALEKSEGPRSSTLLRQSCDVSSCDAHIHILDAHIVTDTCITRIMHAQFQSITTRLQLQQQCCDWARAQAQAEPAGHELSTTLCRRPPCLNIYCCNSRCTSSAYKTAVLYTQRSTVVRAYNTQPSTAGSVQRSVYAASM